jgi:hypothetical protein
MVEARETATLAREAAQIAVADGTFAQHLDRDGPLQLELGALIDDTEPALTEDAVDR